jgi:putative salt-induced outer membrane protein YdiY
MAEIYAGLGDKERALEWLEKGYAERSTFMIFLVDGKLFTDVIRLLPTNSSDVANFVIGAESAALKVRQPEVIRIVPAAARFVSRLEGSIDFGFSFSSGNDQYQTELIATTTYRTGSHSFTAAIDSSFSGQPQGNSTRRNQFTFDYRKQLTNRWFAGGFVDFLQSDQQSLALRSTFAGLIGRNLKQTERTRLSVFAGIAANREKYSATLDKPKSTNADGLAGVDFANFSFSNTDIRSRVTLFPSLTTPGRMRVQATSDLRIKIVKDLWWGFHLYESFDSKPPITASKNDLGVSTSLGWKF